MPNQERVTVYAPSYATRGPDAAPASMEGSYLGSGNHWTREVVMQCELDGDPVEDACAVLRAAAEGLTGAVVNVDTYSDYGDSTYARVEVHGRRAATPEEVRWVKVQQRANRAAAAEREEREIARFRAAHPDLLR